MYFDMTLVIASCFSGFFLGQLPTMHVTFYTTLHASKQTLTEQY